LRGVALLGDIDARSDVAVERALRRPLRDAGGAHEPVLAIRAAQTEVEAEGPRHGQSLLIGMERAGAIGRVDAVDPAKAELSFKRATCELEPLLVDPCAAAAGVVEPDHDR